MDKEQKESLIADCASLEKGASAGLDWLAEVALHNDIVAEQAANLQVAIQQIQTKAYRLGEAAERRMCVGIYGESRAGKSFLVNSLAKGENKSFTVEIGSHEIDFLDCINPSPSASSEGTGVVTRFTAKPKDGTGDHPIFIRILSEIDIVKILVNSSQKDINHNLDKPLFVLQSADEISNLLGEMETRPTATDFPDERHVYELEEYIRFNYKDIYRALYGTEYWRKAATLAPRLPLQDRAIMFSVLWGGQEDFTKLFLEVASGAQELGWCSEAACRIDALVEQTSDGLKRLSKRTVDGEHREGSIISVDSLKELGFQDQDKISIVPLNGSKKGEPVNLPKSLVTALIVELELKLGATGYSFFDTADVLDFPGLKERPALPTFHAKKTEDGREQNRSAHFFLRGKVDYLFQRYKAENEMTALFAVLNHGAIKLVEMRDRVNDWAWHTLGDTPEIRDRNPNTLFFVFAKFDMDLAASGGGEDETSLRKRFQDRIKDGLLKFWEPSEWPLNWDQKPFRNCFWMRNPTMPCSVIEKTSDDQEAGIKPDEKVYVDQLRNLCINDELVKKHMHDPAKAFDAAITPNDGGISYLVENLTTVCKPDLKINLLRKSLEKEQNQLWLLLGSLYDDPMGSDREVLRKEAIKTGAALIKGAMTKGRFAELLNLLRLPDEQIASVHSHPGTIYEDETSDAEDIPSVSDDAEEDINALLGFHDGNNEDDQKVVVESKPAGASSGRSSRFAKEVVQQWIEHLNRLPSNEAFLHFASIDEGNMSNLVTNISKGAERSRLRDKIANHVAEETEGVGTNWNDVGRRVVSITRHHIADYVTWLGYSDQPRGARPLIPHSSPEVPVFDDPKPIDVRNPALSPTPPSYDDERTTFEKHWIVAYMAMAVANADVKGGGVLNERDNDRLGDILTGVGRRSVEEGADSEG